MKFIPFGSTKKEVPAIAIGCMRLTSLDEKGVAKIVDTAMEAGINFFDHADIYGGGECERLFAKSVDLSGEKREQYFIQSKCGIVPGKMYDLSKDYILKSVDGILERLNTEYLDALLLHRPDALVEPEEVAEAFASLKKAGKVRHFGVSNMNPLQIQLLKKCVDEPIEVNQLQLSLPNSNMIRSGMEVNMTTEGAVNRDDSVLDYCRLHDITIQTWSPFQYGMFEGVFIGNEKFKELNKALDVIAAKYETTPTAIASAWILRHPAKFQMISGSTNADRLAEMIQATEISLTREEWYQLYLAAGHILP